MAMRSLDGNNQFFSIPSIVQTPGAPAQVLVDVFNKTTKGGVTTSVSVNISGVDRSDAELGCFTYPAAQNAETADPSCNATMPIQSSNTFSRSCFQKANRPMLTSKQAAGPGYGFEFLLSIGPRQQLIDVAVGMTIDGARRPSVKYASGSMSFSLLVSIRDATVAQCSAPPSEMREQRVRSSVAVTPRQYENPTTAIT
jgi:hypothetical protein